MSTAAIEGIISDSEFPLGRIHDQDLSFLENISESAIVDTVIKQVTPRRRSIARRQILIYFKKIEINPKKIMEYIGLIQNLIEFEKKRYEK